MPPAEINLVSEKACLCPIDIAGGLLPLQFTTDIPHVREREPHARQDDRTDRCPLRNVVRAEDRSVRRIDELARFRPPPVEYPNAYTHIRFDAAVAGRQKTYRTGHRYYA